MELLEDYPVVVCAIISITSMIIGYAFSVSSIMKQSEENTELRVQILETLNRERLLIDEYRNFVLDTKDVNSNVTKLLDALVNHSK